MKIEEGNYEQIFAVLEDGTHFRLAERNGRLEVSAWEGTLAIFPTGSNVVELAAVGWGSRA